MPSPSTAGQLITASLRLTGAIAIDETPSADEFNDGVLGLNDLIETLSTERLAVYGAAVETFATVAAQALYTIGPAGNWNTVRPVRLSGAYCTFNGVDFPIDIIGQSEYDDIGLKTQQQPIIERLLYVNDYPLGKITLWPVPSQIVNITLDTDRVLTNVVDTSTVISYPPGYLLMMRYMLTILLCAGYGITASPEITGIARTALANVKRANRVKRRMTFDGALVESGPTIWQTGV